MQVRDHTKLNQRKKDASTALISFFLQRKKDTSGEMLETYLDAIYAISAGVSVL